MILNKKDQVYHIHKYLTKYDKNIKFFWIIDIHKAKTETKRIWDNNGKYFLTSKEAKEFIIKNY